MISKIDAPYILVEDGAEFQRVVAELVRKPWVAIDVETFGTPGKTPLALRGNEGLDPITATIRLVQLTAGDEVWVVDALRVGGVQPLQLLLDHGRLVIHNAKFELRQFLGAGLKIPPFVQVWDTMLASQILSAGLPAQHSLEALARKTLGVELDKTLRRSDWEGPLTDDQLQYAAEDASILLPLREVLAERLQRSKLDQVMELEMHALPAITWMEHNGVLVDRNCWENLIQSAKSEAETIRAELDRLAREHAIVPTNRRAHPALFDASVASGTINWNSHRQVLEFLRGQGVHIPNTSGRTLVQYAAAHPIIPWLLQFRRISKQVSSFKVEEFVDKHLHPVTGRIHPNWNQLGAEATGRMSCSNPNLQQVPRLREYRSAFRPPSGYVMVKVDYSQIELRVAAEIAQDPVLIEIYQCGGDVHTKTAQEVLGRRNVTKEDRQRAKAINFGFLYGMGAQTFRIHAKMNYGVDLTESEAEAYRQRFFETYPGLQEWHRRARSLHDIRTLSGRQRAFAEIFEGELIHTDPSLTEKLNTPVQGTAADITKAALGALWETHSEYPDARLVMAIHDELVVECPEEQAEEVADWVQRCMHQAGLRFLTRVPIETEAQIGPSWTGE